ncbi:diguanylate cyclase [Desulfovibrio sp. JC010]|uniref:diguanylate cyclase n=1 Tax=Desulfovibrio sp. JC010 TaxID=2593641 RepID=UPI0013D3E89B|nr:PleD family two-component system response regulator [Desulfovibrio sp. JC010]NDV27471.1 PleD family two-component system response regulator [Desulfovibrio sp. JC010]
MSIEHLKYKILIVDDAPANIKLLGAALSGEYRVAVALDGPGTLDIAASEDPPDLILLDIVMPGMDGYEVCRALQENKGTRDIPVIFISSRNQVEDEAKGLEIGAVDYITKPFSLPIVKVRVKTQLELKKQRDMLKELSMIDALTGLPNRRQLENRLDVEWQRARRHGSPLSAAFIDIDFFKAYNDTKGHAMGDECLRLVARELAGSLKRSTDLVVRYGGEEFVALLPDTDLEGGTRIAEVLRSNIEKLAISHNGSHAPVVTVSVGVASMIPDNGDGSDVLLDLADKALYLAKENGRNRIEQFTISS